jgi:hypothetical protein
MIRYLILSYRLWIYLSVIFKIYLFFCMFCQNIKQNSKEKELILKVEKITYELNQAWLDFINKLIIVIKFELIKKLNLIIKIIFIVLSSFSSLKNIRSLPIIFFIIKIFLWHLIRLNYPVLNLSIKTIEIFSKTNSIGKLLLFFTLFLFLSEF